MNTDLQQKIAALLDEQVTVDLAGVVNANQIAANIVKLVRRHQKQKQR